MGVNLDLNGIKNIEAEQTLLGCILCDDLILNEIDIQKDDFWDGKNAIIYENMQELWKNKKNVDFITLKEILENKGALNNVGGLEYIISLPDLVASSHTWYAYQEIIKEKSNRRKMIKLARQIEQIGFKEDEAIKENILKVENISKYIFNLFDDTKKDNYKNTIDFINKFEDFRDNIKNLNGMLGESSPYPILDKYIRGIIKGKVYNITAYSNVGKSKFSYSFVSHFLKQGKKVMYISLEVDKSMLFANLLANYYQKNFGEVISPNFEYEIGDFENLEIYDDLYKLNDIVGIIKYKKPDLVFIDFIQNIQTGGSSEYERMTEVAQIIQQTAITTGSTIFALSQANNESRFKKGESIQPKGSGAIFASSDVILALYKEEKQLYLTILKNKYGKANVNFLANVDFSKGEFKFAEESEENFIY